MEYALTQMYYNGYSKYLFYKMFVCFRPDRVIFVHIKIRKEQFMKKKYIFIKKDSVRIYSLLFM